MEVREGDQKGFETFAPSHDDPPQLHVDALKPRAPGENHTQGTLLVSERIAPEQRSAGAVRNRCDRGQPVVAILAV